VRFEAGKAQKLFIYQYNPLIKLS